MGKKLDKIKTDIKNLNDSEKQRAITWLAYIGTISLAVLTSCLTLIFDLEHFDPGYFFCQLAFNIAFSLIMLILSLRDGRLGNENRKTGELPDLKREYNKTVCQVVDEDSFREWNDQLYEKERQSYVMGELSQVNINDYQYLLISDKDLQELMDAPKENIPYRLSRRDKEMKYVSLDQITEYQYKVIKYYREGKYTFNKINHSFFKSANGRNEYKYYADTQDQDKKAQFWAFFYRILMISIFSAITALAVINPTKSSGETVAYETVSRVVNVLISMFFGYSLAHDELRRAISRLQFIIRTINQYLADLASGIFVPKNRDDIIREKLEEIRLSRLKELGNGINTQQIEESVSNEPKNEKEDNPTVADQTDNTVDIDKKDSANELEVSEEELPIVQQVLETIRSKKDTK